MLVMMMVVHTRGQVLSNPRRLTVTDEDHIISIIKKFMEQYKSTKRVHKDQIRD